MRISFLTRSWLSGESARPSRVRSVLAFRPDASLSLYVLKTHTVESFTRNALRGHDVSPWASVFSSAPLLTVDSLPLCSLFSSVHLVELLKGSRHD